jgi:hypothetical protein
MQFIKLNTFIRVTIICQMLIKFEDKTDQDKKLSFYGGGEQK